MFPLNWILLFFIFITTFLIINSLNYFTFKYENKPSSILMKTKYINWKW